MYTAVPRIGPSIVPSPPMMVTNAISAVHWMLNTAPGCTWSWLIASKAPAAPQPAPATTNTSILASPTRAPELRAAPHESLLPHRHQAGISRRQVPHARHREHYECLHQDGGGARVHDVGE